ncbi:F14O23.11 PROTEIN [Salix purpurea]|uniref:F14O23.11 PROTEIN n=1 Tax=Salix purpurea TaxID=77065 RepID=A0A9Q0SQ04_SALPP|nr:F14O23.11 PROTEIN [Salix purpurea]
MQKRLQISLFKFLLRLPFEHSPKPTNPFPLQFRALIPTYFVPNSIDSPNLKFFQAPVSNLHTFTNPFRPNPRTRSLTDQNRRGHSTESGGESVPLLDVNREVDRINLKFAEAREEIDMASESKETVYFDEEAECARAAVKEAMDMFEGLLGKLPESERAALQRSMGLKMEQLKAELQQLDD